MNKTKKAAFMKAGSFSNININVLRELSENFPDIQIDEIDILPMISRKDMPGIFYFVKEYGISALFDTTRFRKFFIRTPYTFHKIRKKIRNALSGRQYVFSFQTQSVFDLSLPGTPHFVYTDHTTLENLRYPAFDQRNLACDGWLECEKSIYRNAALNFTMSTNISKSIIQDYACGLEKVSCVYCGSNIHLSDEEIIRQREYTGKNILFVGKDWERKGGPSLAAAFPMVLDVHPDATLTVVGSSPDLTLPNCNVVGEISLPDVKPYYEQAAIFCLPTRLEPFGIVFLEAMAHKLPVIGTTIGAIPDFIEEGQNGYMVEPDNAHQLAQRLINLLESPETCKHFGEHGFMLFRNRYNWKEAVKQMSSRIEKFIP